MSAARLVIGLDADDTLWHNETRFIAAQDVMLDAVRPWLETSGTSTDAAIQRLQDLEIKNLNRYGYGAKGFTLSMVETAIEITDGAITGQGIRRILHAGHWLLDHPVELLPSVDSVVRDLCEYHQVIVITKGDLWDQESKVARSGLGDLIDAVEVVGEKDAASYSRVLHRLRVDPANFVMVGNSMKSDVLPVVAIGGIGVHVPYEVTWVHEMATTPDGDRCYELRSLTELPALISVLEDGLA